MTSQELVDFVSLRLGKGQTPAQVCEEVKKIFSEPVQLMFHNDFLLETRFFA